MIGVVPEVLHVVGVMQVGTQVLGHWKIAERHRLFAHICGQSFVTGGTLVGPGIFCVVPNAS